MTRKKMKENHRKLWLWLAKTGNKYKQDWPGWKRNGGKIPEVENFCFACELAYISKITKCPIPWRGKIEYCSIHCEEWGSPYWRWIGEVVEERKKLAKKIAGMWK